MAEIRDRVNKKAFINFLENLGIEVHFDTKARGNSGFCTGKRIDISKNLPEEQVIDVLLHEFAHYVHFKLEPDIVKTDGTLEKLFDTNDVRTIENELFQITQIVFDSIQLRKIEKLKSSISDKIAEQREEIKKYYPDFQAGKTFKEFEKFIKHSNAKYLLKYDCVIIRGGWFSHNVTISIKSLDDDFPSMPKAFSAYIKMKSYERKRNRLTARKSKFVRYLKKPTELFARFFQFCCSDIEAAENLAPTAFKRFQQLKNDGYYPYLNDFENECLVSDGTNA
ncbi:MAG: ImmA/IrrE family metallo-endopeptidase [Candidatus Gastranaerophilales bacterium]|nr:ImmA/IrrE family metallo-endopeptidase [Candidatus Gastranaerophilales bacterium]